MSIWWVNLGQRFAAQRNASALWCPNKTVRKDGRLTEPAWHWSCIVDIEPGELVVLCKNGFIEGIAAAKQKAVADQQPPDGFPLGGRWHDRGWLLPVVFLELGAKRKRDDLTSGLFRAKNKRRPLLNDPETGKGRGTQIYMTRLADGDGVELLDRIIAILDVERPQWSHEATAHVTVRRPAGSKRRMPPITTREAIIQSRVGQGQFRQDLFTLWQARCCATKLDIDRLLVASHIQPWSSSSDAERLDPYNGLLLSAAYDAAFDRGLITLEDDGTWTRVANLTDEQWDQAGLGRLSDHRVLGLSDEHKRYLARHRERSRDLHRD